jgi:hypothetical protein
LVALYQFSRAALLTLIAASLSANVEADVDGNSSLRLIVSLVTGRNMDLGHSQLSATLLFLALFCAATGLGLWVMSNWARRAAIAICGFALFRMGLMLVALTGQNLSMSYSMQEMLAILFFLDFVAVSALIHEGPRFRAAA